VSDPGLGSLSNVIIDFEASWGTAKGSAAARKLAVVSETIVPDQDQLDNPSIRGDFNYGDPAFGVKKADGSLVHVPTMKTAPWFVKLLSGGLTTTGSADPYSHVGKPGTTVPLSCIVEKSITAAGATKFSKTTGARINNWKIPIDPTGILQWSFDMMGKDNVPNGAASYDAVSAIDWRPDSPLDHLQLLAADLKIGGTAVGYIKKGEISIAANIKGDDYRVGGLGTRGSLVPGKLAVTGSLDLVVDDTTILATLLAGTNTTLDVKWTQGANRTFAISLPRIFLKKTGWKLENDGAIEIPGVTFKAVYDSTALSQIVFTIVNDQAGTVYA